MIARRTEPSILITGGSGFVGRLIASQLLQLGAERIVLPIRARHQPEDVRQAIAGELSAVGADPSLAERAVFASLPETPELGALDRTLADLGVSEIVHAAASLDYFDEAAAQAVNIELTRAVLDLGRRLRVERFIYISTAFSAGYAQGVIREALHAPAQNDPTVYTRSKRAAEHLVAESGLPYLILRPSIIAGHSRTGRYTGRAYGLYQVWVALHRFLTQEYSPELHVFAPEAAQVAILHHDAFEAAFTAAYRYLEDGSILNIVSEQQDLCSLRALWLLWCEEVMRPQRVLFYEALESIATESLSPMQKLVIEYAAINSDISTRRFDFERRNLQRLEKLGLQFPNATLDTVKNSFAVFVARSERIRTYRQRFGHLLARQVECIEVPATERPRARSA